MASSSFSMKAYEYTHTHAHTHAHAHTHTHSHTQRWYLQGLCAPDILDLKLYAALTQLCTHHFTTWNNALKCRKILHAHLYLKMTESPNNMGNTFFAKSKNIMFQVWNGNNKVNFLLNIFVGGKWRKFGEVTKFPPTKNFHRRNISTDENFHRRNFDRSGIAWMCLTRSKLVCYHFQVCRAWRTFHATKTFASMTLSTTGNIFTTAIIN